MYAPPKDWTLAQRRALANSLLVEYDNTVDAWSTKVGDMQGVIYNIDAMLQATHEPMHDAIPRAPLPDSSNMGMFRLPI